MHPELVIRNCTFHEQVRFNTCESSPSLIFVGCKFNQGICAREAVFGRSLRFINCDIESAPNGNGIALDLENACIDGELLLFNCRLGGKLFAAALRAKTNVRLRGCQIASALEDIGSPIPFDHLAAPQINTLLQARGWKIETPHSNTLAVSLQGAVIEGNLEITAATSETKAGSNPEQKIAWAISTNHAIASVIDGDIRATGVIVKGRTALLGSICRGNIFFDDSQFKQSTQSSDCSVFRDLIFQNAKFQGDVNCQGASIGGSMSLSHVSLDGSLNCFRLKVTKDLELKGINSSGSVLLTEAQVKGDVSFYMASVRENVVVLGAKISGSLNFTFANVAGLWALQNIQDDSSSSRVELNCDYCPEVNGDLVLSGAKIRWVELQGINVDGIIQFITGNFGTLMLTVGIERSLVNDHEFILKPCRAAAVSMYAIEVAETLDLSGLEVTLPAGWDSLSKIKETQDSGVTLTQSKVGRDLLFFKHQQKLKIERRIKWTRSVKRRIMRSQRAWLEPERDMPRDEQGFPWAPNEPEGFGVSIWGGLSLQANVIGGQLDLRAAHIQGPIYLNDTFVALDLRMDAFVDEDITGESANDTLATSCLHLNAEKLQCNGDVNFTGLRVLKSMELSDDEKPKLEERKYGVLLAHEARIKGQLLFLPKQKSSQRIEANGAAMEARPENNANGADAVPRYALIDGLPADQPVLDLTAVEANHLLLSGKNVSTTGATVSLERGRFGRLEIISPPPGPIDLTKVIVDRWVFGDNVEPDAKKYISVLEQMDPFDRSIWIGVETNLRNLGEGGEADRVYRAMRWQVREKVHNERRRMTRGEVRAAIVISLGGLILLSFLGLPLPLVLIVGVVIGVYLLYRDREGLHGAIGWGTLSWVPMIGALLIFPLSVAIFSDPQYVRASSDLLEVLGNHRSNIVQRVPAPESPPVQSNANAPRVEVAKEIEALEISPGRIGEIDSKHEWEPLDGVALTLRYQVPIMSSLTHSWWEASENRIGFLGNITAQRYATLLVIYHWIAWPLFLIWLGARVIRGKQS